MSILLPALSVDSGAAHSCLWSVPVILPSCMTADVDHHRTASECRALGSSQDLGPALRRGYQAPPDEAKSSQIDTKAEAVDNAAARQPVTRLLLCVHGIGQNLSGQPVFLYRLPCWQAA